MTACIVSCIAFLVIGRRSYSLPIDPAGLGAIPLLAGLFVLGARAIAHVVADTTLLLVLDALIFVLFSGFAVYRFGLLISTPDEPADKQASAQPRTASMALDETIARRASPP
jgi:hypothetical protein